MDQQCVNDGALPGVGIRGVSGKRPGVGVLKRCSLFLPLGKYSIL